MGDLRSPYNKVVKDQTLATPSAPPLEAVYSNPHPNNAQGQPAHPVKLDGTAASYSSIQKDEKFSAWDDRTTEILIVNRLAMNEKFERAQNQQERDELWNEILNHLLAAGYSFTRIDLMQYWEFQFYIYKSNVNSLPVGAQSDSNWKYFELMDNVFMYSVEALKSPREVEFASVSEGLLSEPTDSGVYNGVQSEPVVTSQPKQVLIPAKNKVVVTTQPRSTAYRYTSTAPSSNRYDGNDDGDCCCCWWCCDDCSDDYPKEYSGRRTGSYTTRTGGPIGRSSEPFCRTGRYSGISSGYTSHKNSYNTVDFTDDYSDGYTNNYTKVHIFDNNYYINADNNGNINGDNNGDITSDNNCGDNNREDGRDTNNCCCDTGRSGGTNHVCCGNGGGDTGNDDDTGGGDTGNGGDTGGGDTDNIDDTRGGDTDCRCSDTGGGDTDYGGYDTGGGDADYGSYDTGGGDADYGSYDTGGSDEDYGGCDDGGGDDGGGGDDD